ncbi:putative transcriptional regulator [Psilocybe cyanescens]|uniref:Putative transcriptional regulator n=1 Tax=Psilocybe cyanescens TaxID=93625 RepID=A0A409WXJ8_PSICY|nr:putative transcriptional regulator [Psilocybe cyanescens]
MAPTPTTHDPALSHGAPSAQGAQAPANPPPNITPADISGMQLNGLDQSQIMNLLRSLPGMFTGGKIPDQGQGNPKEDAAQTLSNLAQASAPFGQHMPIHYQTTAAGGLPGINDPGPSSHPRGPPNLGQLSAVAMQAAPAPIQHQDQQPGRQDDGEQAGNTSIGSPSTKDGENGTGEFAQPPTNAPTGGRRGGRSATMGSDEWSRQRKDNHKEVERRRRGNINEGINELGRIVPSGSGEKAKGAILSRAVQYIHHLKENEARNIEKWTLEKLLMDQAMGDLQAQLEEIKRLWEEERMARTRLEAELEVLRNMNGVGASGASGAGSTSASAAKEENAAGTKRRSTDGTEAAGPNAEGASNANAEGERDGKRQRTE